MDHLQSAGCIYYLGSLQMVFCVFVYILHASKLIENKHFTLPFTMLLSLIKSLTV